MSSQDVSTPELLDLTIDNITPNTIKINSQTKDARLKYVMERLVTHLHDFARETRLSTEEWMTALTFLIQCGQICSDVRNVSFRFRVLGGQRMVSLELSPASGTGILMSNRNLRNLSSSPTSSASPSSLTTSTTPNRLIRPKAPSWDLSIRTMRLPFPMERA